MKDLIFDFKINKKEIENLNAYESNVIENLKSQYISKDLTEKQVLLLNKILKRELNLPKFKTKTVNKYKEYYFRIDYHGDYLKDSTTILTDNVLDNNETIDNAIANQYNSSGTIQRYEFIETVEIPENIKNLNQFSKYIYEYTTLLQKFKKARTINSKYNIIQAIDTILNEVYDSEKIDRVLNYNYYSAR